MNSLNPSPPCPGFENDLVELLDGEISSERAREVSAHLESCARCREWQHAYAAIDSRLVAALPRPSLSPDFSTQLRARIAAERSRTPAADLRTAAATEYEHMRGSLLREARVRVLVGVFTLLGIAAAAALFAPLLAAWPSQLIGSLSPDQRLHVFAAFGGMVTLVSLARSALQGELPGVASRA